uniref:alkaline phosphatase D family protein n=1 Tax=uncultured Caulobacter sp. TaxID=158749 RepID=UPI0025CEFFA6|nr:alkaline phosphatase D family protein [uncultured Caulobacter sp.]
MDRRTLVAAGLSALPLRAAAQSNVQWAGIPRLMQGPLLGWRQPGAMAIWTRVSGEHLVAIEYDTDPGFRTARRSEPLQASAAQDFAQTHRLTDLRPGADYVYRVLINGRPNPDDVNRQPYRLRVEEADPRRFRIAFGSCARRARYPVQPIWQAIEAARPDLFLWVGDNVYADSPDPAITAEEHRRQRDLPEIRAFLAQTPQLAIWDDHDYGMNDHDRRHPHREGALETFIRYWPNPSAGITGTPGAFFHCEIGGVAFFFLDVRYHRDPNEDPDTPAKTMLGAPQFDWLVKGLRASKAIFKVLISGSGWTDAKGPGADSWAAFTHERKRLFEVIAGVPGVLLVSGDTHYGEANALLTESPQAYDLYEFVSSPLAQDTSTTYLDNRPIPRVRPPFSADVNFGLLDFDLTGPDPTVSFQLRDERGGAAWSPVVLRASDLVPGARSWSRIAEPQSETRWRRHQAGGRYF